MKTLHQLGAVEVLQNITFMGGAVDVLDKAKHKALWTMILSQSIPGSIKNVYTRKDAILLLYSISEFDWAIGRNPMFVKQTKGVRSNILYEDPTKPQFASLPAVAGAED